METKMQGFQDISLRCQLISPTQCKVLCLTTVNMALVCAVPVRLVAVRRSPATVPWEGTYTDLNKRGLDPEYFPRNEPALSQAQTVYDMNSDGEQMEKRWRHPHQGYDRESFTYPRADTVFQLPVRGTRSKARDQEERGKRPSAVMDEMLNAIRQENENNPLLGVPV